MCSFTEICREYAKLPIRPYAIVINRSCSGQERRISLQPFYRDDRRSGVDHVGNGTRSGHCCAKRVEK